MICAIHADGARRENLCIHSAHRIMFGGLAVERDGNSTNIPGEQRSYS